MTTVPANNEIRYQFKNALTPSFYSFLLVCVVVLFSMRVAAQPTSDIYRVLLISNLDDVPIRSPQITNFIEELEKITTPFALVLNGDFSEDIFLRHAKKLAFYISRRPECRMIVLQGDRDWSNSKKDGWEQIQKVEKGITSLNYANVLWMNPNGCPGPEIITLDNHVQLIGVNTQWFNHPYGKPSSEVGDCDIAELDQFYEELEELVDEHSDQNILIVGHMPVRSNGPYGGRHPLSDWLLPVPGLSGFLTSYRQNVGGPKEINNENYIDFAEDMLDVVIDRSSLIYASGHDKHTEVLRQGSNYLINTGSFGEADHVKNSRFTVWKKAGIGFSELIYVPDGEVSFNYWAYTSNGNFVLEDHEVLFQAPCENPVAKIPVNDRFIPCALELPVLDKMVLSHPETGTLAPNKSYRLRKLGKFFYGEHYRSCWTTPITASFLNLDSVGGGLVPYSLGGSQQLKSLKMQGSNGREYRFRTVDGDPKNSLKYDFKNTIIDVILRDAITTQYPYGDLVVPTFLRQLNILHTSPSLYILPDDPKLGPWRKEFGGVLGYLEERPTIYVRQKFGDADDIKRTGNMMKSLYDDRSNSIARQEFLRARLLDIYLGDWGRNEDSWTWAGYRSNERMLYRPVPGNRSHVFSKWDGVLPWLADREWAKSAGENFDEDIKDMRSLTYESRYIDRFLLNGLSREEWVTAAQRVKEVADRETILTAIDQIPEEVVPLDSADLVYKLTKRAEKMEEFAQRYYEILAKEVDVVGSNEDELFEVERKANGNVSVTMYQLVNGEKSKRYYHRLFYPDETKEIRLFGLSGSDQFTLNGASKKSILVRVIPGLGADSIFDQSEVKCGKKRTVLYLNDISDDYVTVGKETRREKKADKDAYEYHRDAFQFNTYLPVPYIFYNADRGMDFGAEVRFLNYRYGQQEFSSSHKVGLRLSLNGNISVVYEPRWTNMLGTWDIIGQVEYEQSRNFNYYFGKGQFDPYDPTLLDENYYSLNYSTIGLGAGLSHEFWKFAEVSTLLTGYYNTDQRAKNTIADDEPDIRGLNSGFNVQLDVLLDLDLRDSEDLPRSGYRLFLDNNFGTDIQEDGGSYITGSGFVETWNTFHPLTIGVRVGGLVNINDVPYFLNTYLGRNTYLRGFRQNRFLGDQAVFGNVECRIELINTKKTFVPLQFGINLFADAGKLYVNEEESINSDWKLGYGGGVYFVPYKERLTLNLNVGFSQEESFLIQFTLGQPF